MPLTRSFPAAFAAVLMLCSQYSSAEDVTARVSLQVGPFTNNAVSNTTDALVTIKNISADPLTGPFQLAVAAVEPVNVLLYNITGNNEDALAFVELRPSDGILKPGATTAKLVKFFTPAPLKQATFRLFAVPLTPRDSATLVIKAFHVADDGATRGAPVGSGFVTDVDEVRRAATDAKGGAELLVPIAASIVGLSKPTGYGATDIINPPLKPGERRTIELLVDDGKEIYDDGELRFDQVINFGLPAAAKRLSLRFLNDEAPLKVDDISSANVQRENGSLIDIQDLVTIGKDGVVELTAVDFYRRIAPLREPLEITLIASGAGKTFYGSAKFSVSADRAGR
jgi:hypothetical protein